MPYCHTFHDDFVHHLDMQFHTGKITWRSLAVVVLCIVLLIILITRFLLLLYFVDFFRPL